MLYMWLCFSSSGNALVEHKSFLSLGQQAVSLRDSEDRIKALRRVTATAQILLAYSMVMTAVSQTVSRYVRSEYFELVNFWSPGLWFQESYYVFFLQCISVQPDLWFGIARSGRYSYPGSFNDSNSRGQGLYLFEQTAGCKGDGGDWT